MPGKLSLNDFMQKAHLVHGHKYDYSQVCYTNSTTKVNILCPIHGEFSQTPHNHLTAHGCPKCAYKTIGGKRASNVQAFIDKARKVHADKYDYSQVLYSNNSNKITIACSKHGSFLMRPYSHLAGQGCPECGIARRSKTHLYTQEDFLRLSCAKHQNKYDYSKAVYEYAHRPIIIVCPLHGEFKQSPSNHWLGQGCPKCGNKKGSEKRVFSKEEFITEARKIHGDKYDYSNIQYFRSQSSIKILCQKHGEFPQRPNSHLMGQGCPKCGSTESKNEQEIHDFLLSMGIADIQSRVRNIIPPQEIDIYSPSCKIGIEYCGHYWHSDIQKPRNYHRDKWLACREKGVRLITVFEADWELKRPIVESRLKSLFGKSPYIIHARKTLIKEVPVTEAQNFFEASHLQGKVPGQNIAYGLWHGDKLVSVMSFGKPRFSSKHQWELLRFSSLLDTNVIGGATRLFKHFILVQAPANIISYCDLRWGNGEVYEKMGFSKAGFSAPNYFYFQSSASKLYSRRKFQKHRLNGILENYDAGLSEIANMRANGWSRIFDCGNAVFTACFQGKFTL